MAAGYSQREHIMRLAWRKRMNLPAESADFSDEDLFDLFERVMDASCDWMRDLPPMVVLFLQRDPY